MTIKLITTQKSEGVEFVIGMSQANLTEPWRIAMNQEIIEEARKYKNIKIVYKDAGGDTYKQSKDINELVSDGVDLLIVSINDSEKLTPLVSQVYKSMPVIVLDRAVEGYDYSLYIGPDNETIGNKAGQLVADLIGEKQGNIIEVQGVLNSSPVIARSRGFKEVLNSHTNLKVSRTLVGEWQRDETEDKITEALKEDNKIDVIFAHNDYMALGAYKAIKKLGMENIKVIGVDGLSGEGGGIELVSKGILEGTFTCKTGGKEAINYALDILNKKGEIPKKIILRSDKITLDTVYEYSNKKSKIVDTSKKIALGYAQLITESKWRDANAKSIKKAAKQQGVDLVFLESGTTQEDQIKLIRELIKRKVDVISFSPFVTSGWDDVLREAKNAGIPVILSDRSVDSDDSLWTSNICSDFYEEGKRASRVLIQHFGKAKVNILEIEGNLGSTPTIGREAGFNESISNQDNYKIIETVTGNFTFDGGKLVMKNFLKINGNKVNVVYAQNDDMALGAIEAIKEYGLIPGKDIIVLGIDGTKEALRSINKGEMFCTIECSPLLGPKIINTAKQVIAGIEVPLAIVNPEEIFTGDNSAKEIKNRQY
ncbi:MAG: substrate-binding domain-containing protein [Clostridiaceae bacterium]|nr:substrate-binding domain-containing protein [Clostridiaceae bacterium]